MDVEEGDAVSDVSFGVHKSHSNTEMHPSSPNDYGNRRTSQMIGGQAVHLAGGCYYEKKKKKTLRKQVNDGNHRGGRHLG